MVCSQYFIKRQRRVETNFIIPLSRLEGNNNKRDLFFYDTLNLHLLKKSSNDVHYKDKQCFIEHFAVPSARSRDWSSLEVNSAIKSNVTHVGGKWQNRKKIFCCLEAACADAVQNIKAFGFICHIDEWIYCNLFKHKYSCVAVEKCNQAYESPIGKQRSNTCVSIFIVSTGNMNKVHKSTWMW